ncbi:Nectin-2 [Sciurus carolinensis]|uniref:Nectin-2 n=1 Tax=Sciurus carolinensis TaxID=30640 RepID=A0AA41MU04_SCICA|nr:Nectin-2 [Sciurus carolinensis]
MARVAVLPPSRLSPTLPLLLLLLLLQETGAQDVRVQVLPEVRGRLGGTVDLPCLLLPRTSEVRISQVTWQRLDAAAVAAIHPSYGIDYPSPKSNKERLSFVRAGQGTKTDLWDATLAFQGLMVEDEGNYTCEFATFPNGTRRGVTWLRIIAQPQNHAEAQEVTFSLEPMPVARCVSTGGRPPARITWISTLDGEARESQESGPIPGTVTVTSRYTSVPLGQVDGVKVTCKVEHESFEEPVLLPVTLSVRYPPEVSISGYDDNWYLGRSEATLMCNVRSNPEPTGYDWSTISGVFPASAVVQGPQLLVHSVDRLVNTTFICTVTNAVGTGRAEQLVLVRGRDLRGVSGIQGGVPPAPPSRKVPELPGSTGGEGQTLTLALSSRASVAPGKRGPASKSASQDFREIQRGHTQDTFSGLTASRGPTEHSWARVDAADSAEPVPEMPNTAGAGATGGIIGGIIAAIIATAVAATGILICRQQQKEQRLQGAEEEEDLEGPPSYKPPTPKAKLEEPEMPSQLFTLGASEHSPLKTPYFDAGISCTEQEMPRYHELPTLEERSGPLLLGATSLGSPVLVPPGPPAVEEVSLDLDEDEEEEEEEEDYLDKINPIYDALSYPSPTDSYQGKGFVVSRAMYV